MDRPLENLSDKELLELYNLYRNEKPDSKRSQLREQFGMDVKYAVHLVRLLGYAEQILMHGDLDLRKDKEHLKAIRRGEVSEADILKWAADKEISLEKLYSESKIRAIPAEKEIKQLLINCLEQHYGSIQNCIVNVDENAVALQKIKKILEDIKI